MTNLAQTAPSINSQVDRVLTPLSKATEVHLRPARISLSDYIILSTDPENERFIAKLRNLRSVPLDYSSRDGEEVFLINGHKWVSSYWSATSYNARNFIKRIPEIHWLGKRSPSRRFDWILGGTDFTALILYHCWPKGHLLFETKEAQVLYNYLVTRFFSQTQRAEVAAKFKVEQIVPDLPLDWIEHQDEDLRLSDYQKVATVLSLQNDYALFMDRGTGKTPCVIQRICMDAYRDRRENPESNYKVLIVCPPQVRQNWVNEFRRFAVVPGQVTVIKGNPIKRVGLLAQGIQRDKSKLFSVCIVGFDTLSSESRDGFKMIPWDLVVTDESHMFKNPSTLRAKVLLNEIRDKARWRQILTGTPIGNHLLDLYSQLEFIYKGASGFMSHKNFRSFHGVFEDSSVHRGIARLVACKNVPLLQERLARLTFSITKDEAGLKLPDKVYDVHEVVMTRQQAEFYRRISASLSVEIENILSGEVNSMTVNHVLTSLLRLAQITSGFVKWDPVRDDNTQEVLKEGFIENIPGKNPKLDGLEELLTEELEEDPLSKKIIWAIFKQDIRNICDRLNKMGIKHGHYYGDTPQDKRDLNVSSFNKDPEFRIIVANPMTAAEGLNLIGYDYENPENSNTYCDHEIFYSQNWSAILRSQAEDRAHRRGTRMPLRITDLQIPGTIDEEIRKRVMAKQSAALAVTDIRHILETISGYSVE